MDNDLPYKIYYVLLYFAAIGMFAVALDITFYLIHMNDGATLEVAFKSIIKVALLLTVNKIMIKPFMK